MLTFYRWSPLLVGLAAPLLAWLAVTSGTHTGRITRLVALAAVLAALVQLAAVFVFFQFLQGPFQAGTDSYLLVYLVMRVADALASVLAVAAWTLLLIASARTGNRWQLVVFTIVFALTLPLESGAGAGQLVTFPPLQVLLEVLARLGTAGPLPPMLDVLLGHVAALAAFVCALVAPMGEVRGEPTATTHPPAPASDAPPSA